MRQLQYMCPHCGWIYDAAKETDSLVPGHHYPEESDKVCPGSRQVPRNPHSDRRPLWKDQKTDAS
jgi:rubredoxin